MPTRALRPCPQPGCSTLVAKGRCPAHSTEQHRLTSRQRGYSKRWERARKRFLAEHPLCECEVHQARDDAPAARVVDHVIPHRGDYELFWDESNWRAMSKPCHDQKTAKQDGGFGRARAHA